MKRLGFVFVVLLILVCISCSRPRGEATAEQPQASAAQEPERVTVQHILISFKGSAIPKPEVTRSQEDAEALAREVFERAKKGEDFDALVKEFTDDEHPGIYKMYNLDVTPDQSVKEYPRAGMVKAFGDISFSLVVGEIGMTEFDPETSKYGWHIIKRLE